MRIKELDGLRALAVMAVMAHHYLSWLPATGAQFGWLGVDLFFILSGFLITTILVKLRSSAHYFSEFYARRALRIFPLYFLGIAVYFVCSLYSGRIGPANLWAQYIFYYTSLGVGQPPELKFAVPSPVGLGLGVLWSLSVEEIYYTLWAPIVRWTSKRTFTIILIGMFLLAPLLRWWLHTADFPELFTFYCRMDALAMGSMVALAIELRNASEPVRDSLDKFLGFTAIASGATALFFLTLLHGDRSNVLFSTIGVTLVDLSFALMMYNIIYKSGSSKWWMRGLRHRWLRSIGLISYSLYLFHYPIVLLVRKWIEQWGMSGRLSAVVSVLFASTLSLVVAYGLWYCLELPLLKWKNRHIPSSANVYLAEIPQTDNSQSVLADGSTV